SNETPELTVRGYDRRHRLLRGTKTRSFAKMTDSDIAAQIAREQGLRPEVVDSAVKLDYVLQHNQSDLEFLSHRALAMRYEVVVEGRTLRFRPHQSGTKAALPLSVADDVIELHPRLSTRGLVGAIEVRGWDPEAKQVVVGKARAGGEAAMGAAAGPPAADKAF